MIDFSFHFSDSTEEEKRQILASLKNKEDFSNIRCFTGKRWNNKGIAAVLIKGNVCSILNVKMSESTSTEFSDIYFFYEHLIYHLFNFAKRVEWKRNDQTLHNDFLEVIAVFDKKLVGEGRVCTVYNAGVLNEADDVFYYVEQHKKIFIRRLKNPRKETQPLALLRNKTGLPVDISDVQAWDSPEFGRMEYIVLKKGKEKYSLFPSDKKETKNESCENEKIWNFIDDDDDTSFTKEEIQAVRKWMTEQLKDENSTLSRYFAQRCAEDDKNLQEFSSRIQQDQVRRDENLARLKADS